MSIELGDILIALRPEKIWSICDNKITWHESDESFVPPTESEIEQKRLELQAQQDSTQYQRDRASEYSATGEQLDRLWHSIDQGLFGESAKTSDFYLINKDIKDKYPKPIEEA